MSSSIIAEFSPNSLPFYFCSGFYSFPWVFSWLSTSFHGLSWDFTLYIQTITPENVDQSFDHCKNFTGLPCILFLLWVSMSFLEFPWLFMWFSPLNSNSDSVTFCCTRWWLAPFMYSEDFDKVSIILRIQRWIVKQ